MRATRWTNVGLVLVSLSVALGIAAAAGEAMVRYRERTRETVPGSMPFLFYRHQRLRFALVRDQEYYRWVRVNSHGFRGRYVEITKPADVLRIMVVGGSTVFDSTVDGDDHAWPARLGHYLGCLVSGRKVEVINAGVPGYVMLDNLIRLQSELYEFQPDLLILYQAHNDLLAALHRIHESYRGLRTPRAVESVTPWTEWLQERSLLYNKLAIKAKVLQRSASAKSARRESSPRIYTESIEAGAARHEKDLRSFLLIARGFEIPVVVPQTVHIGGHDPKEVDSEIADRWRNAIGAPLEQILAGYTRYEEVTRRVTTALGVPYISLHDAGLESKQWYADGDPIHFNNEGADRMAFWLARALTQQRIIQGEVQGARDVNAYACGDQSGGRQRTAAAQELVPGSHVRVYSP
jgi:lysophospholipase L1-like esterase